MRISYSTSQLVCSFAKIYLTNQLSKNSPHSPTVYCLLAGNSGTSLLGGLFSKHFRRYAVGFFTFLPCPGTRQDCQYSNVASSDIMIFNSSVVTLFAFQD